MIRAITRSLILSDLVANGLLELEYDPELRQVSVQDRNGTVAIIELDEEHLIRSVLRCS
ncbi:MAG: hypothetical protein V3T77_02975 [Planctomycetota bacterium]